MLSQPLPAIADKGQGAKEAIRGKERSCIHTDVVDHHLHSSIQRQMVGLGNPMLLSTLLSFSVSWSLNALRLDLP